MGASLDYEDSDSEEDYDDYEEVNNIEANH
jgi:hypothetical protein